MVSGEAVASKIYHDGEEAKETMIYKEGEYFGERALLTNQARAANIIAKTDVKVASMDREAFRRLLGPVEDIMRRHMVVYDEKNDEIEGKIKI